MPINAKRLTKQYPKLGARDLFRLLMAARARGDRREEQRLIAASSNRVFQIPDFCRYSEAFIELMNCYVFIQLEAGVDMWKLQALMDDADDLDQLMAKRTLRILASRFLLRFEAWQLLGLEYSFDGRGILEAHPMAESLRDLETTAARYAFSGEDLKLLLSDDSDGELSSAEEIYSAMKAIIEERALR